MRKNTIRFYHIDKQVFVVVCQVSCFYGCNKFHVPLWPQSEINYMASQLWSYSCIINAVIHFFLLGFVLLTFLVSIEMHCRQMSYRAKYDFMPTSRIQFVRDRKVFM